MLRLKEEEEENQPARYVVPTPPVAAVETPPVISQAPPVRTSPVPVTPSQQRTTDAELSAYIRAASSQDTQTTTTASPIQSQPTLGQWYHHLVRANPIFHKEVLAQKRLQEKKQATTRTMERTLGYLALAGVYGGFFYLMAKILQMDSNNQQSASLVLHSFLTVIEFLVLVLALPLQAATMITQEREKMTWNALLLSRLSPLQILVGKGAAALRPLLITFAVLAPALLISAITAQLTVKGLLVGQVIIALTAILNVSIALACSLFGKKSQQASGNAGGAVMLMLIGFPALTGIIQAGPWMAYTLMNGGNSYGYVPPEWFNYLAALPNLFNPAVATFFGLTTPSAISGLPSALWLLVPLVYILAATGVTYRIWQKMLTQFWKAPKDFSG